MVSSSLPTQHPWTQYVKWATYELENAHGVDTNYATSEWECQCHSMKGSLMYNIGDEKGSILCTFHTRETTWERMSMHENLFYISMWM